MQPCLVHVPAITHNESAISVTTYAYYHQWQVLVDDIAIVQIGSRHALLLTCDDPYLLHVCVMCYLGTVYRFDWFYWFCEWPRVILSIKVDVHVSVSSVSIFCC